MVACKSQDTAVLHVLCRLLTETLHFLCLSSEKSSGLGNLMPPYDCLRTQFCILHTGMINNIGVCKLRQNIDIALPNK